jgi:hypothetical protein
MTPFSILIRCLYFFLLIASTGMAPYNFHFDFDHTVETISKAHDDLTPSSRFLLCNFRCRFYRAPDSWRCIARGAFEARDS